MPKLATQNIDEFTTKTVDLPNEEFKGILKPKEIKDLVNEMSYDYIKYMKKLFDKMKLKSNENNDEANVQTKTLNSCSKRKVSGLYLNTNSHELPI